MFAQDITLHQKLSNAYQYYRESRINYRRFKQADILPIIEELKDNPKFRVNAIGKSVEHRDLYKISTGSGKIQILLWSQMHGNEPTATMALLDIFRFLDSDPLAHQLLQSLSLHFIPMLNPDGAESFNRMNALGVDLNRDALALRFPESKALKSVRDEVKADFGFNLHDQSIYYTVGRSNMPAAISFLAPAYNYEKEINEVRGRAMKVIGIMNEMLQEHIPGQVAKYNDDFEPRAFGDNIQKWGTSTILIESGGLACDPEKQEIRKLNYLAILTALFAIADESYESITLKGYTEIPENEKFLFDLLIRNVTIDAKKNPYQVDLGINSEEKEQTGGFYYQGNFEDIGDLSIYSGYNEIDATGLKYQPGTVFPETLGNIEELGSMDFKRLFAQGFTTIKIDQAIDQEQLHGLPFNVLTTHKDIDYSLQVDNNPTFVLLDGEEVKYAVVNGFAYHLSNKANHFRNGLLH